MTRQDIFQRRIDTGEAEYHGKNIFNSYFYNDDNVRLYVKEYEQYDMSMYVSVYDILFWPSNFFEVMFWPKYLVPYYNWDELRCGRLCWNNPDHHKQQCVTAKDELQYLVDNLPK